MMMPLPEQPAAPAPWPAPGADFLLESLPWGVLVLDQHARLLRLNQQAALWWGMPQEALQGQLLAQLAPAALPLPLYEALQQASTSTVSITGEFYLPTEQWLAVTSLPQPTGVIVYWQDITIQKQRELQYQTLAENTPDAITRWDHDLRLLYANTSYEQNMGQPLAELVGKTSQEREKPTKVAEPWMDKLRQVFATEQPQEYHAHYAGAQGPVHDYVQLVPELHDGTVHTVLAIARDITKLQQAEQTLRTQAYFIEQVANATADLIYVLDLDSQQLSYLNEPAQRLIRHVPANQRRTGPQLFRYLLHPDDYPLCEAQLAACTTLADGDSAVMDGRLLQADGTYCWFRTRYKVFQRHPDGRVHQVLGAGEDINARKQAKLASQASQQLLQAVFQAVPHSIVLLEAVRDAQQQVVDFRYVLSNGVADEHVGLDLRGALVRATLPNYVDEPTFRLLIKVLETGQTLEHTQYYHSAGGPLWLHARYRKLNDGVVLVHEDVTRQKQATAQVHKHLLLLQQSEDTAQLGSWEYTLATGALQWSVGMYRLFDLPVGTPVTPAIYLERVVADDREVAERLVTQLAQGAPLIEETLRIRVGNKVRTLCIKSLLSHDEHEQPERLLGVDLDISEVRRLEAENLRIRLHQQQELFDAVLAAQEDERKRVAENLHNGLGQLLYAIKLRLDQLHSPTLNVPPALATARREADQLLSEAIQKTRRLSHELVPAILEEFGLAAALQSISRLLSSTLLQLHCQVVLDETMPPLSKELQLALYRMAQELAQNIVKHAQGATEATLALETIPGFVLLRAEDNGVGFPEGSVSTGLGLRSIQDRVKLLQGTLDLGSSAAYGTYVRIRIPLSFTTAI